MAVPPQQSALLQSLTVPARDLPTGCRFEPFVSRNGRILARGRLILEGETSAFKENPWQGTEPTSLLALRERIHPGLRLPDGPPLSRAEVASLELRWMAEVVEGYRALYRDDTDDITEVMALRFTDAKRASDAEPPIGSLGTEHVTRRLIGPVVVLARSTPATGKACARAVHAHLKKL